MRALACLLLTLLLAAGCQRKAKPVSAALPEVAFAGCVEIVRGVCALGRGRDLRVWVQGSGTEVTFSADGSPLPVEVPTAVRGGNLFRLKVPSASTNIAIASAGRTLRVLSLSDRTKDDIISKASDLAQSNMAAARALLDRARVTADKERGARIRSLLGRIDMQEGSYDQALAHLEAASEGFARAGHTLLQSQELMTMSFIAVTRKGDARRAEDYLSQAALLLAHAPQMHAEYAYQRGLLASASGNVRGALAAFEQSLLWAQRLCDDEVVAAAQQWIAMTMSSLGRLSDAMKLQMQLVDAAKDAIPCIRVPLLASAAWLAVQQQPLDAAFARARLAAALESLDQCPDRFRTRNVQVNQLELLVSTGETRQAHNLLNQLRQKNDGLTAGLAVQELELEGRLRLVDHNASDALKLFERAEAMARASGLIDEELRLTVLRARALAMVGNTAEAINVLEGTEQKLDQRLQVVPVGEARVRFLRVRDEGVRALVAIYVHQGQINEAFEAARRGRGRAVRAIAMGDTLANLNREAKRQWLADLTAYQRLRAEEEEAAQAWALPENQLKEQAAQKAERAEAAQKALDVAYTHLLQNLPQAVAKLQPLVIAPGEVILLFFREGENDQACPWRGFAATTAQVKTACLPTPPMSGGTVHPWLRPFAVPLAVATQVRVLATDPMTEEIHAAAFKNKSLGLHVPLVYSLDVSSPPAANGSPLVVGDPSEDLPAARVEGKEVSTLLNTGAVLLGDQATRQAIINSLPRAGWFHYAGHSVFAGLDGLDSGLPLARQQRLSAADVLALPAVPRVVVLSACEAGRSSGDSNTAGLGLAQAFVVAGAKVVIAPTRPVSDEVSRDFMRLFYKHVSSGLPPERALQTTLSEANAQQENDWSTFRALVP